MDALRAYLAEHGLGHGPVTVRRIGEGHSNLTYLASDGVRQVVVRRPPPPPTPSGANDVLREARVMCALRETDVPVPDVLAVAEAGEVLDVALFVMSYVEGPVVTTRTPEALQNERLAIGEALVDTLAVLHAVDWRARGLEGFGRPEGFNARHLDRMARLVGPIEDLAPIETWLRAHVPDEFGATIVHNDFRLGNVVLRPDPPGRVAAVLDWELATIGDPLLDIAYLLASYPVAGEPLTPTGAFGTAVLEPGYPRRDELAERYAATTGRDLSGLQWYTALVHWKLAVLYEYSRRQDADPYYADPSLVRSFLDAAHRATRLE